MKLAIQCGLTLCNQQIMVASEAVCLPKSIRSEEWEKQGGRPLCRGVCEEPDSGLVVFSCILFFKPHRDQWEGTGTSLWWEDELDMLELTGTKVPWIPCAWPVPSLSSKLVRAWKKRHPKGDMKGQTRPRSCHLWRKPRAISSHATAFLHQCQRVSYDLKWFTACAHPISSTDIPVVPHGRESWAVLLDQGTRGRWAVDSKRLLRLVSQRQDLAYGHHENAPLRSLGWTEVWYLLRV